jgi:hypothetical protein
VLQELNSLMTRQSALAPSLGQRLTTREATAGYACVSPNTFDEIVRAGRMPRAKVVSGARKAWDVRVSDLAIDLLPSDDNDRCIDDAWSDVDAAKVVWAKSRQGSHLFVRRRRGASHRLAKRSDWPRTHHCLSSRAARTIRSASIATYSRYTSNNRRVDCLAQERLQMRRSRCRRQPASGFDAGLLDGDR